MSTKGQGNGRNSSPQKSTAKPQKATRPPVATAKAARSTKSGGSGHGVVASTAHALTDAIIGENARERLERHHRVAEDRAMRELEQAAHRNAAKMALKKTAHQAVESIGFAPVSKLPNVKFEVKIRKSPYRDAPGQVFELTGTDYLTSVSVPTNTKMGDVLVDQLITPVAMTATRMSQFASLFDKYVFTDIRFQYKPIVPVTQEGSMIGFCDYDPSDDMVDGIQSNVRRAATHLGSSFTQYYQKDSWGLKEIKKDSLFFCDPSHSDERLTTQGRFILVAASDVNTGGSAALEMGLLVIKYKLHFYITQLDDSTNAAGQVYKASGATSMTFDKPFGTAITASQYNTLAVSYNGTGGNSVFTIESLGSFLLGLKVTASGSSFAGTMSVGYSSGVSEAIGLIYDFTDVSMRGYSAVASSSATQWTITIDGGSAGTITSATIVIASVPNGLTGMKVLSLDSRIKLLEQEYANIIMKNGVKLDLKRTPILHTDFAAKARLEAKTRINATLNAVGNKVERENPTLKEWEACWFCGIVDPDHRGRDCPENPKNKKDSVEKSKAPQTCPLCQKIATHGLRECPSFLATVNRA
jgi:hypothetical protein